MSKTTILLKNVQFIDEQDHRSTGWISIEGHQIRSLGKGQPKDFPVDLVLDGQGLTVLPGFIDVHTHGALGHEMLGITEPGLQEMSRFYASHGVTGFLATPWTASHEAIRDALKVTRAVMGNEVGAKILGAHLEGPWLSVARCGAQDKSFIRPAERTEALEFLNTDLIRLVAVAPEIPENEWLIRECARRGIAVSAGHTNATYAQIQAAIQMGVTQVTHCFNAMSPFNHREPGTVGAALDFPQLMCELIADNIHVHPAAMRLLVKAKDIDHVILISDSINAAGMPEGDYLFKDAHVTVKDGAVRLDDGTLAGSILTMERALANIVAATGRPLGEMVRLASFNPAKAIHLEEHKGHLSRNADADLVLVDEKLQVHLTMVEGKVVYKQF
jgi:N-acetylglucosamine-6-phosphate deacetylase